MVKKGKVGLWIRQRRIRRPPLSVKPEMPLEDFSIRNENYRLDAEL